MLEPIWGKEPPRDELRKEIFEFALGDEALEQAVAYMIKSEKAGASERVIAFWLIAETLSSLGIITHTDINNYLEYNVLPGESIDGKISAFEELFKASGFLNPDGTKNQGVIDEATSEEFPKTQGSA